MSGGVDSSVAAWLLKQQGYEVVGLFMKNWEDDDDDEYCSTRQDLIDAAAVADLIGIDLEAVNFAAEYKDRVFAEFLREYSAGRTPNPDVLCNAEIKFKAFLDHAMKLGRGAHRDRALRAGCGRHGARFELLRGLDPSKDQSYFLHRLNQAQLSRTLFPIGHLRKTEVRRMAAELGLPNAKKKDSTGICFIGERPFREFLNRYLPTQPGPIRDADGRVVGEHVGLAFYTLGPAQGHRARRHEAGLGRAVVRRAQGHGDQHAVGGPGARPSVADERPAPRAGRRLGGGRAPGPGTRLAAKTRYRQGDAGCTVTAVDGERFDLVFDDPQWAVTPGQSAVLYDGEVCLGGGVIEAAAVRRAGGIGLSRLASHRPGPKPAELHSLPGGPAGFCRPSAGDNRPFTLETRP